MGLLNIQLVQSEYAPLTPHKNRRSKTSCARAPSQVAFLYPANYENAQCDFKWVLFLKTYSTPLLGATGSVTDELPIRSARRALLDFLYPLLQPNSPLLLSLSNVHSELL